MFKKIWSFSVTRFFIVGVINTLIDFGILNLLVFVFDLNKIVANSLSVAVAMIISYWLNYHVVFRQTSQNHIFKLITFFTITSFGLFVIQNVIIYLLVHLVTLPADIVFSATQAIGLDMFSNEFILLNTAKLVGTVVTMVWNFLMYRRFVFTDHQKSAS